MRAAWQLVTGYLRHRPLAALLSVGLLALGVGLLSLVLLLDRQLTRQFERNLAGVDLVIGAKGSPLQLVTSTVYHADSPTGNVAVADVKPFGRPGHPLIEQAVPLALGDSYRGVRIVGTTPAAFLNLYDATLADGAVGSAPFEVVVGAQAARRLDLGVGDSFRSVHGLDDNPDLEHADAPAFVVRGVLAPTGLVVDGLLVTSLASVWETHEHHAHDGDGHGDHDHSGHDHAGHDHAPGDPDAHPWYEEGDRDITALLAKFSGRNTATLNFARNLNENTGLMAATPAVVMAQFGANVSSAEDLLRAIAALMMATSLLSLLVILLNALRERAGDLSLLRSLGASPGFVFRLVLLESVLLGFAGTVLGLALGRVALSAVTGSLEARYPVGPVEYGLLPAEWWVLGGSLIAALLAALYPAWRAYRIDPGLQA